MKHRSILTLLFFCCLGKLFAQNDIVNIVPLSPNAASITKFGEIPVSNFTGIPNIAIPLYTVKSGEIEIPIGLSYHSGGVKVESIASWVGLSWSLSGLPSISRTVNSQPDEGGLGYFNMSKSVRWYAEAYLGGYEDVMEDLMEKVRDEAADTEPDVFSFSINGKSGKFYYSQDDHKFVTTPYSNIKIEFAQNFILTGEDGTRYFFEDTETTTVSSASAGNPVTTSWMISKIISASGKDTVSFTYTTENQMTQSLIAHEKNIYLGGQTNLVPADISGGLLTLINAKTLANVYFKGGKLEFIKQTAQREDLYGGYALQSINIYDNQQQLIKRFGFNYKFLDGGGGGNGCVSIYYNSNKWMFLNGLDQISNDGETLSHSFEYTEFPIPPCRNSPAQDYWGYFNGATSNLDLVPTVPLPTNPTASVSGADRQVNPNYTQFGMLTKMSYPSGGYAMFEYENNDSQDEGLPKVYITEHPYIAQEDPEEDGSTLPSVGEYETTFVINNPSDLHLNNDHPEGGAFVSADIQNLGVPIGHYGASILIERILPSSPIVRLYPSSSFQNYYLPNGTYRLKATFDQAPANYQNFWVVLSYDKIDTTQVNKYIGGLRIKSIKRYEHLNTTPITTNYRYTDNLNSSRSSGVSFLRPVFNFSYQLLLGSAPYVTNVMKVKSFSNQQQVTYSGSYVGYKTVFVEADHPEQPMLTSYKYTYTRDEQYNSLWPFPPAQSMEEFRGQLLEKKEFVKKGSDYLPVKTFTMYYMNDLLDSPRLYGLKTSLEQLFVTPGNNEGVGETGLPRFQSYEIALQWSALAKQTERLYDQSDTTRYVETVTDFVYDTPYRQLTEKTSTNSKGEVLSTKLHYPYDLSLTGDAEAARLWLISKNNISAVLKSESRLQGQLLQGQLTHYKKFDGLDLVRPAESISYQSSPADQRTQYFDRYDTYGNLIETHLDKGPGTVYLWSYGGGYPIAELKNTDYLTVAGVLGGQPSVENIASSYPTTSQLVGYFSTLRNSSLLKDAHISTYVHRPLIGLDLQTDTKGMSTRFGYDSFGRLATVKNHYGDILKTYRYNYRTAISATLYQNTLQSQLFTRNNCGTGYAGGDVLYTVAANTYSSTLSQAAADALALADISANGQNYANNNGTCVPASTCKLFRLKIPVSVSSNLYIRYKECGSSNYGAFALGALEVEMDEDSENFILYLNIEGATADFQFQYGPNGAGQVISSIVIEEV